MGESENLRANQGDIWSLLNGCEIPQKSEKVSNAEGNEAAPSVVGKSSRLWFAALDLLGVGWWSFVLLKLFVIDIDRVLVRRFAPGHEWLLDYRSLVAFGALLVVCTAFWGWRTVGALTYVACYPCVVCFWKIPKFAIKTKMYRNWFLVIAAMNGVTLAARNLRYHLLSKSAGILAVATIFLSSNRILLFAGGTVVLGLLVWATTKVIRQTFVTSPFIAAQKALVKLVSKFTESPVKIPEVNTTDGTLHIDKAKELANSIQIAAITNRVMYLWAHKLQQYRESNFCLMFNAMSYAFLFFGATFAFFLMNYALLKAEPTQFTFARHPSGIAMFLYGLSSLAFADGGGVMPRGDMAFFLRIVAAFFGPGFLLTVVVNSVLTYRASRDDAELRKTVEELRERARKHEAEFRNAVNVGIREACRRLVGMGLANMAVVIAWLDRVGPMETVIDVEGEVSKSDGTA